MRNSHSEFVAFFWYCSAAVGLNSGKKRMNVII